MSTLLKRVYSRNPYEAPIMYTNYDGGKVRVTYAAKRCLQKKSLS